MPIERVEKGGKVQPVTWEGCVVKVADKIAYVGRDIEDAMILGYISPEAREQFLSVAKEFDKATLNTTVIMYSMIADICKHSSPDNGIRMSNETFDQLKRIKNLNYHYIYNNEMLNPFKQYSEMVINQIFNALYSLYDESAATIFRQIAEKKRYAPMLFGYFEQWLTTYCSLSIISDPLLIATSENCTNEKIYEKLQSIELYVQAIIDYISGMTDRFAISLFNELLEYKVILPR